MSIKKLVPDYYFVRHSSSELDSALTYRNNFKYFVFRPGERYRHSRYTVDIFQRSINAKD